MNDAADLAELLARQIAAVDKRVTGGGGRYDQERHEVRVAAQRVVELRSELSLGRFVRSLTPPTGKPQFLLLFDTSDDRVVLKVYGRSRPSEAQVLERWNRAEVPAVRLREHGDRPTSWLTMDLAEGFQPDGDERDPTPLLATTMALAHRAGGPSIPDGRPLQEALDRHISNAVATLEDHGYEAPPGWRDVVLRLYGSGEPVVLHGDLTPRNLLVRSADEMVCLLDPCGYLGPAEFDAARWCARVGGAEHGEVLLRAWQERYPLDVGLSRALLGAELLMEAGVRELILDEQGQSERPSGDAKTCRLLESACSLLAEGVRQHEIHAP